MPIVSIYNNKGGVGKSTLTVGLAEFLAANRNKSVLVIDLDAQASSSGAILGRSATTQAVRANRTVPRLFGEVIRSGKTPKDLSGFVTERPAMGTRGTALESVGVIVPDKAAMLTIEEGIGPPQRLLGLRDRLRPALASYDFTLIDLPGNIDQRSKLAVGALSMSDFVLIPVEPSQIALSALPDTFDLIHYCRELGKSRRPAIIGLVLNKTDKRTEQYRSKFPFILEAANRGELPAVFENVIPDTTKLASATDETRDFATLKERFDTYYDHVRKVAGELVERCQSYSEPASTGTSAEYGGWFRSLFTSLAGKKKGRTTSAAR